MYIDALNLKASLYNSVPHDMLSRIERETNVLMESIQNGQVSQINVFSIAEKIVRDTDESQLREFVQNAGSIDQIMKMMPQMNDMPANMGGMVNLFKMLQHQHPQK
jgi:DNA phosphorothioation-dependent restriction protein DptG